MSCLEGHRTNLGFDDKADRLATNVLSSMVELSVGVVDSSFGSG